MKLISEINWNMLRLQKQTLLGIIAEKECIHTWEAEEQIDDLEGILGLIDSIQDYAVDEMGVPEEEVFGLENEEQ